MEGFKSVYNGIVTLEILNVDGKIENHSVVEEEGDEKEESVNEPVPIQKKALSARR